MKSMLKFAVVAALALGATTLRAEDKAVTLTGEGKCAKCALKVADKCQNVVEVKSGATRAESFNEDFLPNTMNEIHF